MKVAGFTIIRNALEYDYPIVEAIRSILPICDIVVVAVGKSDDRTLELIKSIGDLKVQILETEWDDSLREGGRVLALETDKAFQAIPADFDWCFYIQGDECVHERDLPTIRRAMEKNLDRRETEGLLFQYRHFYGSYDYIGVSRRWYRREVRIVRNNKNIRSYRDAQGFRWKNDRKLRVRQVDAWIHHYGWVRHPQAQQRKQYSFNRLWHADETVAAMLGHQETYEYAGTEPLERFHGTHPAVMLPRIEAMNWQFEGNPAKSRGHWKDRLSRFLERHTGWLPGEYRNYLLIK
ncbi:MAG: glycosyltransferase family 2 protein [Lewinellaceae bacterium]|nr:glycosyltransferase family 2 protein [Lewinellaceae bacterium]